MTIFHTIGFTFWVYKIKRVSWCPTNKGNSVLKNETNKNAKFMWTMKTHKCFKDGFGLVAFMYRVFYIYKSTLNDLSFLSKLTQEKAMHLFGNP